MGLKKQIVWIFHVTNKRNLTIEDNEMKERNESLLIAMQNNAIRTNYVIAKIYITQQKLQVVIETKRSITSGECCKLAQKEYDTRHDWCG